MLTKISFSEKCDMRLILAEHLAVISRHDLYGSFKAQTRRISTLFVGIVCKIGFYKSLSFADNGLRIRENYKTMWLRGTAEQPTNCSVLEEFRDCSWE